MPLIDDYLFSPNQRLYWAYLYSAAVLAVLYRLWQPPATIAANARDDGIWRGYWLHRSALLDYRYFVVVWLVKLYLLAPLVLSAKTVADGVFSLLIFVHTPAWLSWPAVSIVLVYTASLFVAGEFSRYWLHRWLHTLPWLWQFHKVHHSAEVLNPLTFYRVHPFENLLFGLRYALSAGTVTGLCLWLFGARLSLYTIGGANAAVALFALVGGNLRHSHVYLRYPHRLEKWLMSPAQHQLHHTGTHARFNYGGYLSVFDRLFGTLQRSNTIAKPMQFGFPKHMGSQYHSVTALLWQPLRDCYALWRRTHENPTRQNNSNSTGRLLGRPGCVDDAHRNGTNTGINSTLSQRVDILGKRHR